MSCIERSAKAQRDATEIWRYIAADDLRAADHQIRRIDEKLSFLADTPHGGQSRPELGRNVRSFVVGRYLIIYRPLRDGIRLVRILNASRDTRRALRR